MPNSSGYPTREDIEKIGLDEQKRRQPFEYLLPRDREQLVKDFTSLAARECFEMCAFRNLALDKQEEITRNAAYACRRAIAETKCLQFTNYVKEFERIAMDVYCKSYEKMQELLRLKTNLFPQMQDDYRTYGWRKVYADFQGEIERYIQWGNYGR